MRVKRLDVLGEKQIELCLPVQFPPMTVNAGKEEMSAETRHNCVSPVMLEFDRYP